MPTQGANKPGAGEGGGAGHGRRHQELIRRNILRLFLTYIAPFLLLLAYFAVQSGRLLRESRDIHLRSVAEHQANILDLFLRERLVNLSNLIDDPRLAVPPTTEQMRAYLEGLMRGSDTFVDVGFFTASGVQAAYAGPYPSLANRSYQDESWFKALREGGQNFVITDIYLGFRDKPHFTIAVRRVTNGEWIAVRAALDPGKIYEYISSLEGSGDVVTLIVNEAGFYQVVTPHLGSPLQESAVIPPRDPRIGVQISKSGGRQVTVGYAWLSYADWALMVQPVRGAKRGELLPGIDPLLAAVSFAILLGLILVIVLRSRQQVQLREESEDTRAQLEHAGKLAAVGELAGGIAHEINNPLAVISEEAGLMKDMMDPAFGMHLTQEELVEHLDNINEAVFRCRDITRKLLGFVRRNEVNLKVHSVNEILDGVLEGFLTHHLTVSNIRISRDYDPDLPPILTDRNQLEQVILNLVKNAQDAISGEGVITLQTRRREDEICISVSDDGGGMSQEQLGRIFMPFYTTKEVGKGTGLGLSVSYGIVRSLGGRIEVTSAVGRGTTFVVCLPVEG